MSILERFAGPSREAERVPSLPLVATTSPREAAQAGVERVRAVVSKAFDAAKVDRFTH